MSSNVLLERKRMLTHTTREFRDLSGTFSIISNCYIETNRIVTPYAYNRYEVSQLVPIKRGDVIKLNCMGEECYLIGFSKEYRNIEIGSKFDQIYLYVFRQNDPTVFNTIRIMEDGYISVASKLGLNNKTVYINPPYGL